MMGWFVLSPHSKGVFLLAVSIPVHKGVLPGLSGFLPPPNMHVRLSEDY